MATAAFSASPMESPVERGGVRALGVVAHLLQEGGRSAGAGITLWYTAVAA